jgi:ABC-type multidrug transport system fused ATPase/permease subunit
MTIAHRLNTIINYDRILFLENGEVGEFDKPKTLLEDKNSKLYKLIMENG